MMFWKGYNDLLDKQPILTKVRGHNHSLRRKNPPLDPRTGPRTAADGETCPRGFFPP
jgi:hypothetical protein